MQIKICAFQFITFFTMPSHRRDTAQRDSQQKKSLPKDMPRALPVRSNKSYVRLMNAIFYAHHGVSKAEHKVGARYEVDAELELDFSDAGKTDKLSRTVDYAEVYAKIRDVITPNKFYLIEAVAERIASELLTDFAALRSVRIRVRKRNPPVGGVCDYAEADYFVERN
jgi:7,8-dihydroneopterin aldolase/epimerase/oxygenase